MVVYALFEDVAGVDEVEAICRVPGIDGVAVGAYDLAASMGHPGEPWREDVQAVVERVLQTCRRNRMPFGTVPRDRADLGHQIARGCQLITVAILEWGIQATGDAVAELSALALPAGATPDPPPPDLRAGNGELSHGPGGNPRARPPVGCVIRWQSNPLNPQKKEEELCDELVSAVSPRSPWAARSPAS